MPSRGGYSRGWLPGQTYRLHGKYDSGGWLYFLLLIFVKVV